MTKGEYIISLSAWNYYISSISEFEVHKLLSAFGTLGKALTEFQSIYSVFAHGSCKRPYIPTMDEYKEIVKELRLRTEASLIVRKENWQTEIYFD